MDLATRIQDRLDGFLPLLAHKDEETLRHCRLMVGFGFLGGIFGLIYATFYASIGHYYGAGIIAVCDGCFLTVPLMLKHCRGHFKVYGHFLCAVLAAGFSSLAAIEGGVRGHAITWLATIPFCAVLLINIRASYFWCVLCVVVTIIFCAIDAAGIRVPFWYSSEWHAAVTMAGYVGLAVFLFLLVHIFERGRLSAHQRMIQAYHDLASASNQLVHVNLELENANSQLVRLNQEKNEFIGIAAHDLKNPLTSIQGFSEILSIQSQPTHERNQLYAGKIRIAAERMLHLITDLLNINAMEEGRLGLKIKEVDLGDVVNQVIADQQLSAGRKGIEIHFAPLPSVVVMADASATLQIAENFISNAIKYSPAGCTVRIKVTANRGEVMLAVEDEGPGLSAEDQRKLFQKFSRLTPQPTGGESSNGLGLSIVKRLAESMGGRVGCSSQLGKGSVFWVSLRGYHAVVAA